MLSGSENGNIKIVQSIWTKPLFKLKNAKGTPQGSSFGGWMSKEYFYYSWSLSALTIREYYDTVELVTDSRGKKLLSDVLGLPYTQVSTHLDIMEEENPKLWAKAKFHAYTIQETPFIHIDGDIFLYDQFTVEQEAAEVIVQNQENNFKDYKRIWEEVMQYFPKIPAYMQKDFNEVNYTRSYNSGVFGGTNLDFIKDYVREAMKFLQENIDAHNKLDVEYAVLIYEQYLLGAFSRHRGVDVQCIFQEMDEQYSSILDYKNTYHKTHFFHALGLAKSKFEYCNYIRHMLLTLYPEYYYRIHQLIKEKVL